MPSRVYLVPRLPHWQAAQALFPPFRCVCACALPLSWSGLVLFPPCPGADCVVLPGVQLLWKYTAAPAAAQPGKAGGGAGAPQTCPAIEREPLAGPAVLKGPGKRKAVRRVALGNEVLARVWHSTRGDPMAALRGAGRHYVPDYMDYMSRLAQEMDPESGIEEEYKVANSQVGPRSGRSGRGAVRLRASCASDSQTLVHAHFLEVLSSEKKAGCC